MSFDIVVLQPHPDVGLLSSLVEVQEAFPLGTPEQVQKQCDLAVPDIRWSSASAGLYRAQEGFTVEFSIPDEMQPSSLHLALHFGSGWETGGSASFDQMIKKFFELYRWQSFAVSDNSSLLLEQEE